MRLPNLSERKKAIKPIWQSDEKLERETMEAIKQMLLGIAIMVASIAFYSVWDSDTVTVIVAIIGFGIVICGCSHKDGEK